VNTSYLVRGQTQVSAKGAYAVVEPKEDMDARLVVRARMGDEKAFAALYTKYSIEMYKYLAGLVTREEAEDLLQETFWKAYRGLASLQEGEKFQGWLYRIARNCAYDYLRSRRRYAEHVVRETDESREQAASDDPLEYLAEQELLRQALADVPLKQRECFLLHLGGLPVREIALIVGLSESSVPIYQGKARRCLYERYQDLKRQADGTQKGGSG
jgi:RNA polymerase sigma-70 factor, ECF subfamily